MTTNEDTERAADPVENFGAHLRSRRQLLEMSQTALAEAVGELGFPMVQQTIAKIEAGTRPVRLDEAAALARAVGLTLPQMLQPPINLAPGALKRALRRSREAVAKLEEDYTAADEARRAADLVAEEAASHLADVRRQLALRRDEVDSLSQLVNKID